MATIVSLGVTYSVATAIYLASTIFAFYLVRVPRVSAKAALQPANE
jgi:hypothetical protein